MKSAFETPPTSALVHQLHAKDPSRAEGAAGKEVLDGLQVSFEKHQICMIIPVGAKIDALTMDLPGGILILGSLRAQVRCKEGSAIIAKGGEFQGSLHANDVLVEGNITSPMDTNGKPLPMSMSVITAHGQRSGDGRVVGGVLALSADAFMCAKANAVAFQIPRSVNLSQSTIEPIVP